MSLKTNVFELIFLQIAGVCIGYTLVLNGSDDYIVLNRPYTLTCMVEDAELFDSTIYFYRDTALAGVVYQGFGRCEEDITLHDQIVSCGAGTLVNGSKVKKYILHITTISDVHINKTWHCQEFRKKIHSNNLTMLLKPEVTPIVNLNYTESPRRSSGQALAFPMFLLIIILTTFFINPFGN